MNNGKIFVESQLNKGSTFRFTLLAFPKNENQKVNECCIKYLDFINIAKKINTNTNGLSKKLKTEIIPLFNEAYSIFSVAHILKFCDQIM
jgi:hypothetical protein